MPGCIIHALQSWQRLSKIKTEVPPCGTEAMGVQR